MCWSAHADSEILTKCASQIELLRSDSENLKKELLRRPTRSAPFFSCLKEGETWRKESFIRKRSTMENISLYNFWPITCVRNKNMEESFGNLLEYYEQGKENQGKEELIVSYEELKEGDILLKGYGKELHWYQGRWNINKGAVTNEMCFTVLRDPGSIYPVFPVFCSEDDSFVQNLLNDE